MGVGFAIHSNLAKVIANQLIEHGEVTRGYLGIVIQQLTSDLAESFGIDASQGVLVAQVSKHSPAEAADLRQGDIIERFQGEPVKEAGKFRNQVALTAAGRAVELTILRDGKYKTLRVTIGKLSKDKLIAETSQRAEDIGLTECRR